MGKAISTNALDAALDYIANRAVLMALCAGAPVTAGDASTLVSGGGNMLASLALTPGSGGDDFALAPGTVAGRRLVVSAQAAVAIVEAGVIDHLALVDTQGGELLVLTELTETQIVSAGEIISVKSFGGEIVPPV